MRRLGLAISYFVAIVYVISILLPSIYCLRTGCKGPAELDAFMPAFLLTLPGVAATAVSLVNAVQNIKKNHPQSWAFWPLAIVFSAVLFGGVCLILWMVYQTVVHRPVLHH
jgi:hypothetical protein